MKMDRNKLLFPELVKNDKVSVGGIVKAKGEVLKEYYRARTKPPNMNCRVQTFSRICESFDKRRKQWVVEMGFGGLLKMKGDIHVPRQVGYWLLTRVDPVNKIIRTPDGQSHKLCRNQVHWVLGIPNGSKVVPSYKTITKVEREKVDHIVTKYGKSWVNNSMNKKGKVYKTIGIPVNPEMLQRIESYWEEHEEEEFKTLFLLVTLEMVLCPTLTPRLASDLVPSLLCATNAAQYDWCTLVITKLMGSIKSFGHRFYDVGYGGGCGGCILFLVILYLDRLDRDPIGWTVFPRVKVWKMKEIAAAIKEDSCVGGDFGALGTLDVAYGERHPREARDTNGPSQKAEYDSEEGDFEVAQRRRRGGNVTTFPGRTSGYKEEIKCEGVGPSDTSTVTGGAPLTDGGKAMCEQSSNGKPHIFFNEECLLRWISIDGITLLTQMASLVLSSCDWMEMGMQAYVCMFDAACERVLCQHLCNFVIDRQSTGLAIVSELYDTASLRFGSARPSMCRICLAFKSSSSTMEFEVFHGDSFGANVTITRKQVVQLEQLQKELLASCLKGHPCYTSTRNVLLYSTNRGCN